MWMSVRYVWVSVAICTARVFDPYNSVDTSGNTLNKETFRNQRQMTLVHNPHAYFLHYRIQA